jgi:membrane-associated phospholipid phosphatase
VQLAANPYAAMPSLHSADALIIGVAMALIVRAWWARLLWLAWPAWVWFTVMATANHFWLDVVAGVAVALLAAPLAYRDRLPFRRRRPRVAAA